MENLEQTEDLKLKPEYFDCNSSLNVFSHTKRVMIFVKELGKYLPYKRNVKLAYYSAFLHDMAKIPDELTDKHGEIAATKKLPLFEKLFLKNGIIENELDEIAFAVTNHSLPNEVEKNNPYYITTAILKDADGLDRVRLGDLNPDYFRFKETKSLIPFATDLYNDDSGRM